MLQIYLISAQRSVLSFQSVLSLATTDYDGTEEKTILYQSPPILNVHPILAENHLFEFTTRLLETESARGFTRSRLWKPLANPTAYHLGASFHDRSEAPSRQFLL